MSSKLVEMRTVQQYKEYAESTEQLNEALNNEIKQCYWQIDSLKADLKRQSEGSPNRDSQGRLISQLQMRITDLEFRGQGQATELQGMRTHTARIEIELKEAQQQHQFKSRLLKKAEEELQSMKETQREADRKYWELEQKCKLLQEENGKQLAILKEQAEIPAGRQSLSQSRKQQQQQLDEIRQKFSLTEQKLRTTEAQLKRNQEDNSWLKQLVADKAALEEMLMKQVSSVTNERIAAERIAKDSDALLISSRGQVNDLRHKLTVVSGELKDCQNKLHLEEQKARRCIEESNQMKSRIAQKDQLNNRLEGTIQQLEARLNELESEINGYRRLTDQSRMSLAQSRHTNQQTLQLRAELNRLSSQLAIKNQAVVQFSEQIESLSSHITKLEATHTLPPVEEQLELAANQIISLRNQLHQLGDYKQQPIELVRTLAKLREENNQLRASVSVYEEEARKRNQESLRQSNTHNGQKLSSSRLKAQFAEALRKNNALIEANARLEIVRNQLHQEVQELKQERLQLPENSSEVAELKQRLTEAYSQLEELSRTSGKQNSHSNSLKLSTFDSDKPSWRQNASSLKQLKSSTSEHWLEMQRRIDNLRSENDTLRKNLSFTGQWRC